MNLKSCFDKITAGWNDYLELHEQLLLIDSGD
jgi:hypothetical protein